MGNEIFLKEWVHNSFKYQFATTVEQVIKPQFPNIISAEYDSEKGAQSEHRLLAAGSR